MKSNPFVLLLLFALLFAVALAACDAGGDDDDAGPGDDDNDDAAGDDDTSDPPVDPYADLAPAGPPIGGLLAISSHISRGTGESWTRDFEIEKLAAAGVRLLRTDFKWDIIESSDNDWYFDGYDTMVDLIGEAGIEADALMDYGVDWAMPGGSHDEIDPAAWGDFCGSTAAHFADRIDTYEIWNEQNTSRFWKPEPNPDTYGALLKAGYTAIHEADPEAQVLFGGLSSFNEGNLFSGDGNWDYLLRVAAFHPDICEYMDGFAIHPYTFVQQTMPEQVLDLGVWAWPDLEGMMDQARNLLGRIGCPDTPIHLTEAGWPDLLIGPARQAAYLARGLMLAASKGAASYYWYTFWDGSGNASLPTEDAFGLFTYPHAEGGPNAKPNYKALVALNDTIGGLQYAGDLGKALGWGLDRRALAFSDGTTWVIALWHATAELEDVAIGEVPFPEDLSSGWEILDQDGRMEQIGAAGDASVIVPLQGFVRYLVFSRTER